VFRNRLVLSGLAIIATFWLAGCGGSSKSPSVTVTATATTVDATNTVTLTATVANDKSTGTTPDGVTWSVSGGGALSNTSTTSATYTAPAATNTAQTITITATSVADTTKTGTITLTVPAKLTVTTTAAQLAGAVGAVYSVQLTTSAGISPYKWTLDATSAALPTGWNLSSSGLLTGPAPMSAQAGTYNLVFDVTDSGTPTPMTASQALTLTINPASAIVFTGVMPTTATYNTAYAGSVAATGGVGALGYTVSAGALPTGLGLNASTGAVTGTPTAVGPFNFSITAADAFGDLKTQPYTITVGQATPTLTFAAILAHTYGDAAFAVSASSASSGVITYSVTSGPATISGNMVTLTGAGTVVLGAIQAATTDYAAPTPATASFLVNKAAASISVTPYTVTYDGNPHTATATATGVGGAVLSASDVTLSGTTHTAAGTYASDPWSFADPNYVSQNGTVTDTISQATATVTVTGYTVTFDGTAHTATATATGVGGAVLSASDVTLSGTTHTAAGTYASDPWSFADPNYVSQNGTVTDTISQATATVTVTGYTVTFDGTAHTATATATGVGGAVLSATDFTLTGTTHTDAGTYATDPWSFADANYVSQNGTVSDTINQATPTLTFTAIPVHTYGDAAFAVSASSASSGVITYSVTSGPATISGNMVTLTGAGTVVLGASQAATTDYAAPTPATASFLVNKATATITVTPYTVTYDGNPHTATGTATGVGGANLNAGLNLSGTTHTNVGSYTGDSWTFTDATGNYASASGTVTDTINGEPVTLTFAAISTKVYGTPPAGDGPFTVSATSASSGTVTYSVTSGPATISGSTVTLTGAGTVVLGASQAASGNYATGTASITFTVNPALSITTASPLPTGAVSTAYSQALSATGGLGSYTWSLVSGGSALSGLGLSFNASTGTVAGSTPVAGGPASFTVQVADANGHTTQATFSVTISASVAIQTSTLSPNYVYAGSSPSYTLVAVGGATPYTWSVTSGSAALTAAGLSLNSSTGVLSGNVPSNATTGPINFTVQVKDVNNVTSSQSYTLTVYGALTLSAPSSTVPGPATVGEAYGGIILASGGSGTYSWVITVLPADGLSSSISGDALHIIGTPASAQTVTFNVTLTDTTTSQSVGPYTYSIVVSNPATLTLPTPNPSSLPSATVNQNYSGAINATGGASPYTWTVNGTTVPTNGTAVSLTNGLNVTNTGGNTLSVGGTPTSTGTVNISASIKDNLNTVVGPNPYTVTVNAAGQQVSGQISLTNNCGNASVPTIALNIYTGTNTTGAPYQTIATSDSQGNYSFYNVPTGSYTIVPSITGATSVFYPATLGVTVSSSALTGQNFGASLGYTVSGNVNYGGSQTGQVYLMLNNNNCSGNALGTSFTEANLTSGGAYTIQGVPPGSYTLIAAMDTLGLGAANASSPSGKNLGVSVSNVNVTGATVTMTDPTAYTIASGPILDSISPTDLGVVVNFEPVTTTINNNSVETPTFYTVQWSTSSSFSSPSSATFKAAGANGNNIWILNNGLSGMNGTFSNNTAYFFRARGELAGSQGPWTVLGGSSSPTSVTIGAPTAGSAVSGAITFTGTATGPLYVGFFDQSTGIAYATHVNSPVSPQSYSVKVPNGTNYFFFAILDQNNDGMIDAGDITNTGGNNTVTVISGTTTLNLTLPSFNSKAKVTTQYWQQTNSGGTSTGYTLNFDVREGIKLPVAAQLISGPNVINPIDIGKCLDCGSNQFRYYVSVNNDTPTVGDTYTFKVTYSDGNTENVSGAVTAVLNAFATNLSPTGTGGSTTPTFTWSYPSNASSYVYQFYISDNNGSTIWQIPSNNSKSNGFTSTQIPGASITWGTDPTDSHNSVSGSLSTSTMYNWQIQVQDSNGNTAQTQVQYQP
jgi:hypothetical protein